LQLSTNLRLLRSLATALITLVALLAALDLAVRAWFPILPRVATDFSSAYLGRELHGLAEGKPQVIFFGDSVVWGYGLRSDQAAVSLLRARGCECQNLAFEGGSPPNDYALLRALLAAGVRPKAVVFNVNQKVFNSADSAYQKLHPALTDSATHLLRPDERTALIFAPARGTPIEAALDRSVSRVWLFYAMRSDLREALFGDVDAAHAVHDVLEGWSGARARGDAQHRPTPDRFEGTYDLTPLTAANVGVIYLQKMADLLEVERIPAIAFMTPTNHALLRDYIDSPQYRDNGRYLRGLLERRGVRVLDLDRSFGTDEFLDNDHLTAAGQRHLASLLSGVLPK
jgi:lysophospholipase L1-like esterase